MEPSFATDGMASADFWAAQAGSMKTTPQEFVTDELTPEKIPGWARDAVYYAQITAGAALIMVPDEQLIMRASAALLFVGGVLAKSYRK